jgi:hypothetical protein
VKEVGRMTFGKWFKLFKHYQTQHDIKVKGLTYQQLREEQHERDEWL